MPISTYVLTPVARLAFPALAEGKANKRGQIKFGGVLLIPKDSDITVLKQLVADVIKEVYGDKPRPPSFKLGIKNGDEPNGEGNIPKGFENNWVINATSNYKPRFFDATASEILDPSIFYAGCYVRAQVNCFSYASDGNKGISFGISAIQFIRDGEKLAGSAPAPAFAPVPGSAAATSSNGKTGNGKTGGDSLDDLLAD